MMNAILNPLVTTVVLMTSAQIGKTEVLNNILGYHVDKDPCPIIFMHPTLEMAESHSKERLAPMFRDTPCLTDKIREPRAKDSGNTLRHKKFDGGFLSLPGANSPASLAARPVRLVLCDEVDRYPVSAGTEGDPIALATKRTATFWNSKRILTSTPSIAGASRIELAYGESDQRRYYVPCPHCGEFQTLEWVNLRWPSERGHDSNAASYKCGYCIQRILESSKVAMLAAGEWRASEDFTGTAGFSINELYSPWVTWPEMIRNFLEAKKDSETLRVFTNTSLGETWREHGEGLESDPLLGRREPYDAKSLPDGIALLTAGVDIQDDRIEVEVVGWGRDEESWGVDYQIFHGDPHHPELWNQLDAFLRGTYTPKHGHVLDIMATAIDTGHCTEEVYRFCKDRWARRVLAIKGVGGTGRPIAGRSTKGNSYKVPLFPIGTDSSKELLYGRLKLSQPGPGYCHFPATDAYDQEYFDQLTAEKAVVRYYKGVGRREWVKVRNRNEALDCRVYAVAAYRILNPAINAWVDQLANAPKDEPQPETETEEKVTPKRRIVRPKSGGWVRKGWG